jgi:hypothetical protein
VTTEGAVEAFWLDGKPEPVAFTAIIENGILKSVNCL